MSEISMDEIEIAQALAQMEKHQAEAEYAKWQARREELNYAKEQLEYDFQLDGIYTFTKAITPKSANHLLHAMAMWHHHDPEKPWTIHLNSVGGLIQAGTSVHDELKAHSVRGGGTHHVTIKVRGWAASMAGVLLQSADERIIGPGSQLMIHESSSGVIGKYSDIAAEAEWHRHWRDWLIGEYLARTDKITRPQFLKKIERGKDWWLSAHDALALGFVDGVG